MNTFKPDAAENQPAAQQSHDPSTPKALVDFMLRDWKPPSTPRLPKIRHADAFAARREALSRMFPARRWSSRPATRRCAPTTRTTASARAATSTTSPATSSPTACWCSQPQRGRGHHDVLFVEPNPGRADATFFTDRVKGELWVGPRLGVPESRARFAVDECRGLPELNGYARESLRGAGARPRACSAASRPRSTARPRAERARHASSPRRSPRCGCIKDAHGDRASSQAAIALDQARLRGRDRAPPARQERARGRGRLQPARARRGQRRRLRHHRRRGRARLHRCTGRATTARSKKGDLLLLDAGVEGNSLYTADITRTLPVSRQVHQGAARDLRARARGAGARRSRR